MLYNKSTGKPKVGMLELDSLIKWLERQPTDGTYIYSSSRDCLMARYFTAKGLKNVGVVPCKFKADRPGTGGFIVDHQPLPVGWEEIAQGPMGVDQEVKWTFGEA